jgi:uncharacterized membrane protein YfcA
MPNLESRLASSLRRSPFVWMALIVLLFILLGGSVLRELEAKHPKEWIGWVAGGFIAYSILTTILLLPRLEKNPRYTADKSLLMRWTFAIVPFFVGWASVALGSFPWPVGPGFVASVWFLVLAARCSRAAGDTRA